MTPLLLLLALSQPPALPEVGYYVKLTPAGHTAIITWYDQWAQRDKVNRAMWQKKSRDAIELKDVPLVFRVTSVQSLSNQNTSSTLVLLSCYEADNPNVLPAIVAKANDCLILPLDNPSKNLEACTPEYPMSKV